MSYKSDSKEEALQKFGSEIIKILKNTNPESRKRAIKIFRDIKDMDLFGKATSFEESPLFEYANQLDDEDPPEVEAARFFCEICESMKNHLKSYRGCLEADDVKILRNVDVEKDLSGDYLRIVDWFDYARTKRMERKAIKKEEDDWRDSY